MTVSTGGRPLRSALFVDFDNVFSSLRGNEPPHDLAAAMAFAEGAAGWLTRLESSGGRHRHLVLRRCYVNFDGGVRTESKWRSFSSLRRPLIEAGFEVVDCPGLARGGKNAADIRMCLDVMDLVREVAAVEEVVLLSADSDFTPLFQRLRMHDIRTFIGPVRDPDSSVARWADESMSIEDLRALVAPPPAGPSGDGMTDVVGEPAAEDVTPTRREAVNDVRPAPAGAAEVDHIGDSAPGDRPTGDAGAHSVTVPDSGDGDRRREDAASETGPPGGRNQNDPAPEVWSPSMSDHTGAVGLAELAVLIAAARMPRLDRPAWTQVFETIHRYLRAQPFRGTADCEVWCRRQLAVTMPGVGRKPIAWTLTALASSGIRLSTGVKPGRRRIAEAVQHHVLAVGERAGLALSPPTRAELAALLGLAAPVAHAAGSPARPGTPVPPPAAPQPSTDRLPAPTAQDATADTPARHDPPSGSGTRADRPHTDNDTAGVAPDHQPEAFTATTDDAGGGWAAPSAGQRVPAPFLTSPTPSRRVSVPAPRTRRAERKDPA